MDDKEKRWTRGREIRHSLGGPKKIGLNCLGCLLYVSVGVAGVVAAAWGVMHELGYW